MWKHNDSTWQASSTLGWPCQIWSVGTAECPESISQWNWKSLYNVIYWESSDITVQCITDIQKKCY